MPRKGGKGGKGKGKGGKGKGGKGKAGPNSFGPSEACSVDFTALSHRLATLTGHKFTWDDMNQACLANPGKDAVMDSKDQTEWMRFSGDVEATLINQAAEERAAQAQKLAEKAEKTRHRQEFYVKFVAWCKDQPARGVATAEVALMKEADLTKGLLHLFPALFTRSGLEAGKVAEAMEHDGMKEAVFNSLGDYVEYRHRFRVALHTAMQQDKKCSLLAEKQLNDLISASRAFTAMPQEGTILSEDFMNSVVTKHIVQPQAAATIGDEFCDDMTSYMDTLLMQPKYAPMSAKMLKAALNKVKKVVLDRTVANVTAEVVQVAPVLQAEPVVQAAPVVQAEQVEPAAAEQVDPAAAEQLHTPTSPTGGVSSDESDEVVAPAPTDGDVALAPTGECQKRKPSSSPMRGSQSPNRNEFKVHKPDESVEVMLSYARNATDANDANDPNDQKQEFTDTGW